MPDKDEYIRDDELLKRWRLVLGKQADEEITTDFRLSEEEKKIDELLGKLYQNTKHKHQGGGLKNSRPQLSRWLGDIRTYFPKPIVQVMQKDAMKLLGLRQMLLEPELLETFTPDVHLVSTLLSLQKAMPQKTRAVAKEVVGQVVKDIEQKLKDAIIQAIRGSLNRSVYNYRPHLTEINWQKTLLRNIKNYQPSIQKIIPERIIGIGRKGSGLKDVILCIDQSASMASSLIYASIFGSILASISALKTSLVVFDTAIADLTKHLEDPIGLLFSTQLGGGTDINHALGYVKTLIKRPEDTTLILISDLFEGGNQLEMLKKAYFIKQQGVNMIVLLALNDEGTPAFDEQLADKLQAMDITSFACTPDQFPDFIVAAIERRSLQHLLV